MSFHSAPFAETQYLCGRTQQINDSSASRNIRLRLSQVQEVRKKING